MAKQRKTYDFEDNVPAKIEEPAISYTSPNVRDTYLNAVSEDLFKEVIVKAIADFDAGFTISNNQIDGLVKTRMRWK